MSWTRDVTLIGGESLQFAVFDINWLLYRLTDEDRQGPRSSRLSSMQFASLFVLYQTFRSNHVVQSFIS